MAKNNLYKIVNDCLMVLPQYIINLNKWGAISSVRLYDKKAEITNEDGKKEDVDIHYFTLFCAGVQIEFAYLSEDETKEVRKKILNTIQKWLESKKGLGDY